MTRPDAVPVIPPIQSFAYRGQDPKGEPVSGTIDAPSLDDATNRLHSLGLRITSIQPLLVPPAPRPLRSADFLAFNEQLAQLTTAGLPVEHGLRLIAQDLNGGRLAATVSAVADQLDRGIPLADALAQNRNQFPPLYARLVEAGVKSNSLGGLLFNLSTHLEMVRRLRATLWRTFSYPLMVLIGLMIVLIFLTAVVFPQFQLMFQTYRPQTPFTLTTNPWQFPPVPRPSYPTMPLITQLLFAVGGLVPYFAVGMIALFLLLPLLWRALYYSGSTTFERYTFRVPLIGPILRTSLLARWCDITRLGVTAGLDLPAAIRLAGDAIASPGLARDGNGLIGDLEAGRSIDSFDQLAVLPRVVPAAIEMASRTNDLRDVLASLSEVYRRQADTLLDNLPTILSPILLLVLALSIGFVIIGLMLPVMNYIHYVSGVL